MQKQQLHIPVFGHVPPLFNHTPFINPTQINRPYSLALKFFLIILYTYYVETFIYALPALSFTPTCRDVSSTHVRTEHVQHYMYLGVLWPADSWDYQAHKQPVHAGKNALSQKSVPLY